MPEKLAQIKEGISSYANILGISGERLSSFLTQQYGDDSRSSEEILKELVSIAKERMEKNPDKKHYIISQIANNIARDIGNVPKEVISESIDRCYGTNQPYKDIAEKISSEFSTYANFTSDSDGKVPLAISDLLATREAKMLFSKIMNNPNSLYEHSENNYNGVLYGTNLGKLKSLIQGVIKYITIHQGDYKGKEFIAILQQQDFDNLDSKDIEHMVNNLIAESIKERLNLEDTESLENKKKIADYVYNGYITEGYFFRGSNIRDMQITLEKGLSGNADENSNLDQLKKINKIFEKHGMTNVFLTKANEIDVAPYFYTTDSFSTALQYGFLYPEYFERFIAGIASKNGSETIEMDYIFRDQTECLNSVLKLCEKAGLDHEEHSEVLSFFHTEWKKVRVSPDQVGIACIKRNKINRHQTPINYDDDLQNKSVEDVIADITASRFQGSLHYRSIPATDVSCISIPSPASYTNRELSIAVSDNRRFFTLDSDDKLYYDILIHNDSVDADCILLTGSKEVGLESATTKSGKGIDIICCSDEIEKYDAIIGGEDAQPSFQSIQMMIAVNGIANTDRGKELVQKARENFTPEFMANYYGYVAKTLITYAKDSSLPLDVRQTCLARVACDLLPKAIYMEQRKEFPNFNNDKELFLSTLSSEQLLAQQELIQMRGNSILFDDSNHNRMTSVFEDGVEKLIKPGFATTYNQVDDVLKFKENFANLTNANKKD